tara:strand:- start:354 stop:950 length:597 start_codon:yes stop_codon:yes gene_type:complete
MSNARLRSSMKTLSGFLLNETTISNDATINFGSSLITDDYDLYDVYVKNLIPATDDVSLQLRLGVGGSLSTGASDYSTSMKMFGTKASDNGEHDTFSQAQSSEIHLTVDSDQSLGTGDGESWSARYRFYNLRSTTLIKGMEGLDSGGMTSNEYYSKLRNSQTINKYNVNRTSKVDTISIFASSGNLTSGTISLYGIKI